MNNNGACASIQIGAYKLGALNNVPVRYHNYIVQFSDTQLTMYITLGQLWLQTSFHHVQCMTSLLCSDVCQKYGSPFM